jgi:hypothetical protein
MSREVNRISTKSLRYNSGWLLPKVFGSSTPFHWKQVVNRKHQNYAGVLVASKQHPKVVFLPN